MKIKKVTKNDIEIILKFRWLLQKYESKFDSYLNLDQKTKLKFKKNILKTLSNKNVAYFIIYDKRKPIGTIEVYIKNKIGIISSFYVLSKFRDKSFGYALFKIAIKWLRNKNIKKLIISIYKNNIRAVNFYKTIGCRQIKTKDKEIIMIYDLF